MADEIRLLHCFVSRLYRTFTLLIAFSFNFFDFCFIHGTLISPKIIISDQPYIYRYFCHAIIFHYVIPSQKMYKTKKGHHGNSVEFSPSIPGAIACATSSNFGIAGDGHIYIFCTEQETLFESFIGRWNSSLLDVSWNRSESEIKVATSSGDGSLQMWSPISSQVPIKIYSEHTQEVYGVDFSHHKRNLFLSASHDGDIKLWDANESNSLSMFTSCEDMIYSAIWSPQISSCFASSSARGVLQIWDTCKSYMPQIVLPKEHASDIMSCDWCQHNQYVILSAGTDGIIHGWDLRQPQCSVFRILGHRFPIRRIKCSLSEPSAFATCSYDFTVCFWDFIELKCLSKRQHHTEFVCGLAYNSFIPNQVADCSWDETIRIYSI